MNSLFSMARCQKAEPRPPATPLPWSNGEAKTACARRATFFIRAPRLPLRSFFKKREQLLKTLERPPIMNGGHYLTRGHIISVLLYRKTNLMSTKKIALPGGRLAHNKNRPPGRPFGASRFLPQGARMSLFCHSCGARSGLFASPPPGSFTSPSAPKPLPQGISTARSSLSNRFCYTFTGFPHGPAPDTSESGLASRMAGMALADAACRGFPPGCGPNRSGNIGA